MKKILAALLLTASVAGAASANMTGFYVGVGAVTGATTANYNEQSNVVPATTTLAGPTTRSNAGKTMWGGRLEAGYGMTFAGCGWFGVSIYATALNTKISLHDDTSSPSFRYNLSKAELKNSYNYGAEFKLGYHFTKDTVGFIGIAAEAAQYKLSWTQGDFTVTSSFAYRPALTAKKTKVYAKPVLGVRTTGLGGNRNLFVEAKYGYGFSNRVTLNAPQDATGVLTQVGTSGRTISARPRTHEFSVTLGWRF